MIEFKWTQSISVTQTQVMGSDVAIVAAARVSTVGEQSLKYKSVEDFAEVKGLINFLMKHQHGTPFEHGALTVMVRAPLFVWREWHRHRIGFSYNEESARYKKMEPEFYIPPFDRPFLKEGDDWKPGRPKFKQGSKEVYDALVENLKNAAVTGYLDYLKNLDMGVDPGLARACLPVNLMSSCWVTANPRSIMHFLGLRTHHPEAQRVSYPLWEINAAANALEHVFKHFWPVTWQAFVDNGRVAP